MSGEAKTPKVARDAAELEVDLMLEALGVDSPDGVSREMLVIAAMGGRITFDAAASEGVYTLAVPVELKNGERLGAVKFHEPNGAELQAVSQGMRLEVDGVKKTGVIDLAQGTRTAIRFLTKVSGIDLGVAERVKARDLAVIEAIAGFFL